MDHQEAAEIYRKYRAGTATPSEKALLEQAYRRLAETQELPPFDREAVRASIWARVVGQKPRRMVRWLPYAAAVLLVGLVATGILWGDGLFQSRPAMVNEIDPGGNKATLTLADGRTIPLSEAKAGIVIQGEAWAYDDGTPLTLESLGTESSHGVGPYVSLTTPRGGQYQVTLPDGTKVWLNAHSTLRYPTRFGSQERVVELVGEAYFDVAHDASKPFHVRGDGQEVQVLGTEFNVSAYPEDTAIQTTLVEGSVRLQSVGSNAHLLLVPGEQGKLADDGTFSKSAADIEAIIAWKNGLFVFNNNVRNTLDQISRWYDVEIEYQDLIADDLALIGKVSRHMELHTLLGYLEEAAGHQIHFTVEGRRVIVRK